MVIIYAVCHAEVLAVMIIKTRIFELYNGHYKNLSDLAQSMGISVSQIYRVHEGKRNINQKFIIGAIKAFPGYKLDDLFYLAPEPTARERQREESAHRALEEFALSVKKSPQHLESPFRAII